MVYLKQVWKVLLSNDKILWMKYEVLRYFHTISNLFNSGVQSLYFFLELLFNSCSKWTIWSYNDLRKNIVFPSSKISGGSLYLEKSTACDTIKKNYWFHFSSFLLPAFLFQISVWFTWISSPMYWFNISACFVKNS